MSLFQAKAKSPHKHLPHRPQLPCFLLPLSPQPSMNQRLWPLLSHKQCLAPCPLFTTIQFLFTTTQFLFTFYLYLKQVLYVSITPHTQKKCFPGRNFGQVRHRGSQTSSRISPLMGFLPSTFWGGSFHVSPWLRAGSHIHTVMCTVLSRGLCCLKVCRPHALSPDKASSPHTCTSPETPFPKGSSTSCHRFRHNSPGSSH